MMGKDVPDTPAPAARRRRGALRRRSRRPRRRRRPLHRRGRGRPRRRRVRPAARARRLHHRDRRATCSCTTAGSTISPGRWADARSTTLGPVFDDAALVVEETIYQQAYVAWPMETRGIVAEWSAPDGSLTVWAATQAPHDLRGFAARLLGIPENRVRVIARDTGGAFGQKIQAHREDICVLLAARKVPGPLKYIEDRRENLMASSSRREHGTVKMAFDADGTYLAATIDVVQDVGAYPMPWPVGVAAAVGMIFPGGYRLPNATWTAQCVFSNTPGRTAYRGPWQFETVAREMVLDIAARELGIDPADLRRRNMLRRDELPYSTANRMQLHRHDAARDVRDGARHPRLRRVPRRAGHGPRRRAATSASARASYVEPTASGMPHHGSEGATIRVEPSGRGQRVPRRRIGGQQPGDDRHPAHRGRARRRHLDGQHRPGRHRAHAVRRRAPAAVAAARWSPARSATPPRCCATKIATIAAHVLEASPDDIVLADGRASVAGSETIGLSLAEIADIAYFGHDKLPREIELGLEASARYRAEAYIVWANATHVCTCEVDIETGIVHAAALRRRRGLRADDQPERRRGPDRGRHGAGHRRRAARGLPVGRGRQPAGHHVRRLPPARRAPRCRRSSTATSRAHPGPDPAATRASAKAARSPRPPAVANAVADALAPLGVKITRLPLSPSTIIRLIDDAAGDTKTGAAS